MEPKPNQQETEFAPLPTGPAAAATWAAGIGVFALGLATFLAEVFKPVGQLLNWYPPVGPLLRSSYTD